MAGHISNPDKEELGAATEEEEIERRARASASIVVPWPTLPRTARKARRPGQEAVLEMLQTGPHQRAVHRGRRRQTCRPRFAPGATFSFHHEDEECFTMAKGR